MVDGEAFCIPARWSCDVRYYDNIGNSFSELAENVRLIVKWVIRSIVALLLIHFAMRCLSSATVTLRKRTLDIIVYLF